jgi:hypothetical protein
LDFLVKSKETQGGLPTMYFAGNVGIGTTIPLQLLDVRGGNAIVSGNVGIGTTVPKSVIDVVGNMLLNGGNIGIGTGLARQLLDVQGGNAIISGSLGIGTTTPIAALHVNGTFYASGSIVQVQHVMSPATRQSITTQDISAITGLEINFTPRFATSKLLLQAMVNHNGVHVSTVGFLKNNGYIIANTNTNSQGSISTTYFGHGPTTIDFMYNSFIQYLDTINSTSTINYKVGACASWAGTVYTLFINDRNSNDMRSVSSFTIFEIAT